MFDVDDEFLVFVGNGLFFLCFGFLVKRWIKRRCNIGGRRDLSDDDDDDLDEFDLDVEGSNDEEVEDNEIVNFFWLEGIYKDEEDWERLLDMLELDWEVELVSCRDLIV